MKLLVRVMTSLAAVATLTGCPQRAEVSTTTGVITVGCDDALLPVMTLLVAEFQRRYPEAVITLAPAEARSAVVDFVNDSTKMIVLDRPLNGEELNALTGNGIDYRTYPFALDAVGIIVHPENPVREMRLGQLDSILTGIVFRWPARGGALLPIQVATCGPNSSTHEIVRTRILNNRNFSPATRYVESIKEVVEFVRKEKGALGVVSLGWAQESDSSIALLRLGDPNNAPDSTQPPGRFYSPAQANVYRNYYPLSTKSYIYNRELLRTVGLGLISFVNGIEGQKIVQKSGLVPATMPVRLVETTSRQVTTQ